MQSVQKTDWQSFEFFKVEKKTRTTNIFGMSPCVLWITVLGIINKIQREKIYVLQVAQTLQSTELWRKLWNHAYPSDAELKNIIRALSGASYYYVFLALFLNWNFQWGLFLHSIWLQMQEWNGQRSWNGQSNAYENEIFDTMLETDEKMGECIEISVNFLLSWLSAIELNRMGYN